MRPAGGSSGPTQISRHIGWRARRRAACVTGSLESLEPTRVDALRQGLREHGYVEGQNILIEYHAADGRVERLPALAAELARLKVDVLVAVATPGGRAAQQATTTIPIVVV